MRLGTDPEFFLLTADDKPVSVCGMIGADKWNPLQMHDMPEGFNVQEDNVALELGMPPAASAEEFYQHLNTVMKESLNYVATGLKFSKLSCIIFPKEQLAHPMAQVFGCEPDFNAWTKEENKKPNPPHKNMRSAGGHIHVETKKDPYEVVKMADLYLSVPLVLMDEGFERKAIYGKAGACRVKSYGVEYRTPSNWWTAPGCTEEERKQRCDWVWRNMERAEKAAQPAGSDGLGGLANYIQTCINTNDKELAKRLIVEHELEVL
jgi:hypothetical protein